MSEVGFEAELDTKTFFMAEVDQNVFHGWSGHNKNVLPLDDVIVVVGIPAAPVTPASSAYILNYGLWSV